MADWEKCKSHGVKFGGLRHKTILMRRSIEQRLSFSRSRGCHLPFAPGNTRGTDGG